MSDGIIDRLRREAASTHPETFMVDSLLTEAADEIERLRLFERYANSTIEGQVADAIETKKRTGKYPFED